MDIDSLKQRSNAQCELCEGKSNLSVFEVSGSAGDQQPHILVCDKCARQIDTSEELDSNHWRCLNNSMWSEVPAVQVMSHRLLRRLQQAGHSWAVDLLDSLYLDDELLRWANAGVSDDHETEEKIVHKDSNGNILQPGDTVVLIKDLDVKGGGFTAKRGTAVRGIALVENNASQIEGRVNGQQIVILTQYVKKA